MRSLQSEGWFWVRFQLYQHSQWQINTEKGYEDLPEVYMVNIGPIASDSLSKVAMLHMSLWASEDPTRFSNAISSVAVCLSKICSSQQTLHHERHSLKSGIAQPARVLLTCNEVSSSSEYTLTIFKNDGNLRVVKAPLISIIDLAISFTAVMKLVGRGLLENKRLVTLDSMLAVLVDRWGQPKKI